VDNILEIDIPDDEIVAIDGDADDEQTIHEAVRGHGVMAIEFAPTHHDLEISEDKFHRLQSGPKDGSANKKRSKKDILP
jgi:hypothetical protein